MSILDSSSTTRGDYTAIIGHVPPSNAQMPAESQSLPPAGAAGQRMHALATRLFPIFRSLTGPGVRETLHILREYLPLTIHSVLSGTPALDWTVPDEWTIRDAFIANEAGERLVSLRDSTLHVVGYSEPVDAILTWQELKPHLHTLPEHPDWIPYRTSYYHRTWGFCLTQRQFATFAARGDDARYHVRIDATLAPGELNYGEYFLPGETSDEVLFSCHVCHPSLANDNLSGIVVALELAQALRQQQRRRYGYRFLFVPATIGALAWLAAKQAETARIKLGLVLTLLGDAGHSTYKRSRQGNAEIDQVMEYVLECSETPHEVRPFTPYGYDERQYCSPGFNLPVGCLMRTPHGEYPEYHTSADNLEFLKPAALEDSFRKCLQAISIWERNQRFQNLAPFGEPQLGRRGLYQQIGGDSRGRTLQAALLWVLNYSDGEHSLLDISRIARLPFDVIHQASELLVHADLLALAEAIPDVPAKLQTSLSLEELWE